MKSATRILVSLALTIVFLALFFRSFDVQAAGRAIASASPVFLLLGVVLNLLAYLVRNDVDRYRAVIGRLGLRR